MPDTEVRAELDRLRRLVLQERSIDLIALGPYMNLVYTDDEWYSNFPTQYKNRTIYDLAKHEKPSSSAVTDIDAFIDSFDVADDPFHFVIAHYSKVFPRFTVCDIGGQYGTSAMETVLLLRSLKANFAMFSFEPGIAATLTPLNYENNGFSEIRFYAAAAGPLDGYVALHRELGHSADNRIVNPIRSRERGSVSVPVRCVKIDTILKLNRAFAPTVAKIDTQGGEPGVLAGMSELLQQHPVSLFLEYTPRAIENVVDPAAFIGKLLETHYCFDTGINASHLFEVTSTTTAEHRAAITATSDGWVDLLLVPRTLPDADQLCARIRAAARPGIDAVLNRAPPAGKDGLPRATRLSINPRHLQDLTNSMSYREAVALLEGVDLNAERDPSILYHAGVCFGAVGREERAIDLLKRAAAKGFAAPWCAYHLGLVEAKCGKAANAAYYYSVCLILDAGRTDIYPLLNRVAPDIELTALHAAQAGTRSETDARAAFDLGAAKLAVAGRFGAAAHYFTTSLALSPEHNDARERLLAIAPDILLDLLVPTST